MIDVSLLVLERDIPQSPQRVTHASVALSVPSPTLQPEEQQTKHPYLSELNKHMK